MPFSGSSPVAGQEVRKAATSRRVLVVDDSAAQRRLLSVALTGWGFGVTEAASGEDALALCALTPFDFVISDWMMPGMTGLEFCKAFRALPREDYGYFILLTSKSDKGVVSDGLDSGADDFLAKPVSPDELHARLRAGERILRMQAELVEKNRLIGATLGQLQTLYDSLDRDLIEARKLQQTLLRETVRDFGRGCVHMMMHPSGHVGGDLVGCFAITPTRIAVYSVDVSGHGVASAMMTARLAGMLSGESPDQNIALVIRPDGGRDAWPPDAVAARLNRMMLEDMQVDQYLTMAYAEIDLATGNVRLVQAGHPHPAVLRKGGRVEYAGNGGLPIGLIPQAAYAVVDLRLDPGDRLFLLSDGVTECPDAAGSDLGTEGLALLLQRAPCADGATILDHLVAALRLHAGSDIFPDDVSGVTFLYRGP